MPNNASARRDKDKKNKDKKKKGEKRTDTLSLPKEDTSSMDSGTLSLSSAGKDQASRDKVDSLSLEGKGVELDLSDPCFLEKAHAARQKEKASASDRTTVPVRSDTDISLEYHASLTVSEQFHLHEEVMKANPGVKPGKAAKEFMAVKRAFLVKKALEAKDSRTLSLSPSSAGKDKAISKDGSSLSGVGTKGAANTAALKQAEQALLLEFACSLTDGENLKIHHEVVKANPGLSEKDLSTVKRAVMIAKAEAWKGRLDEQHKSK